MIPLRDEIPTRRTPVVNYLLITVNVLVFILEVAAGDSQEAMFNRYAMIPAHFTDGVSLGDIGTIFSSMFMHAGLLHIGGNMLYLWIFGDNVEDAMGHGKYLAFYLIGGVVASVTHILSDTSSTLPTVGASGAIAAVLGAYLVLYPYSRVHTAIPVGIFLPITVVPASVILGLWFVMQLFDGVLALGGADIGGVAVWAHVGGFIFGAVMAMPLASGRRVESTRTW
jgi:membrane associated rhomboid family serine protease